MFKRPLNCNVAIHEVLLNKESISPEFRGGAYNFEPCNGEKSFCDE